MSRMLIALAAAFLLGSPASQKKQPMNFFITSAGPGKGAELGGLEGADRHCHTLVQAAGAGSVTWHAYLSTIATATTPAVNARDRIGAGPWYNAKGVLIARNLAHLHSDSTNLGKQNSLTEKGDTVNGRGDQPNMHDILTGSNLDGTAYTGEGYTNCGNWTSSAADGATRVGHHDRNGGGENPNSWNSAHNSRGCGQENLRATGGNGLFYCFTVGR